MSRPLILVALISCSFVFTPEAHARRATRPTGEKPMTVEEALEGAEKLLDSGGDASQTSEKLHKTRGLKKDELARLELIDARCALLSGAYAASEKVFGKLHKATPDDARLTEWYARSLDGLGKSDAALPLLEQLAKGDQLHDGDSYWLLAKLERKGGQPKKALEHARLALEKPIVLQSDELEKEMKTFISELAGKSK